MTTRPKEHAPRLPPDGRGRPAAGAESRGDADAVASPTTLLVVLDGWGLRDEADHNAIRAARTPHWDRLWASPSKTRLDASGTHVGLPRGQMGNSEVGHMNLGAGRVVYQDLTRIGRAVENGELATNQVLQGAIDAAIEHHGVLQVLGLLSPGGVHSHEDHLHALVALAVGQGARVRLHAFLDGRDVPPKSALSSLRRFEQRFPGTIASITGRYYAMDRDARWERTQRAYDLLRHGNTTFRFDTPEAALEAAYARGESDEFVQPTAIQPPGRSTTITDGDAVVFMNFRADRARQLTRAFTAGEFDGFERHGQPDLAAFVTLTRYAEDMAAAPAFPPEHLNATFGECLQAAHMTQLRIAETEKYAHVTYFFSGGREAPFVGEDRVLVPSPKVATYDLAPAMSAVEVTDRLVDAIDKRRYDAIVCNYANGDMVGHTGVFDASVRAVETIDTCLGRIVEALARTGSQCLITSDHGNVECLIDREADQPHTAHTSAEVPLVYAGPLDVRFAARTGTLANVAPTLLALMGLPQPPEMTAESILAPAPALAAVK